MSTCPEVEQLLLENQELRRKLEDAEDVIHAIRSDRVDAFVVEQPQGDRVVLLETADRPYRTLVEKMQQGAVAIAEDGTILYCNQRFCDMLKQDARDILGAPIHRFLSTPFAGTLAEGPVPGQGEFGLQRAGGAVLPVHIAVNPVQTKSSVTYLIVTDQSDQKARLKAEQVAGNLERELTERQRVERSLRESEAHLAEADRRKNEFLAVLAHELRNPLSPIRNAVHVLQGDPAAPGFEEARRIIERQVVHMARLLDDLLDVSRIAAGKISLRKRRLDLVGLLREVVEDYRPMVNEAGLTLALELPEEPLWADGDPTRLAQVLGNVLHNAVKFTRSGGRIEIAASRTPDGRAAVIAIRDDGDGMDSEALARVFDAFSRGTGAPDGQEGLGLGMTLARGLVELHGGRIDARSDGPKQGSEFSIQLPLERQAEPGPRPIHAAPAPSRGHRILVIEDNVDSADSLRILLQLKGHEVAVAYDGPEGIETAKRFRPEIVLCDIGLPGALDGYAVAEILRRDFPRGSAFLVALTGYGQEGDQRRSHEAGFDFHLLKPADPEELEKLLSSIRG